MNAKQCETKEKSIRLKFSLIAIFMDDLIALKISILLTWCHRTPAETPTPPPSKQTDAVTAKAAHRLILNPPKCVKTSPLLCEISWCLDISEISRCCSV